MGSGEPTLSLVEVLSHSYEARDEQSPDRGKSLEDLEKTLGAKQVWLLKRPVFQRAKHFVREPEHPELKEYFCNDFVLCLVNRFMQWFSGVLVGGYTVIQYNCVYAFL